MDDFNQRNLTDGETSTGNDVAVQREPESPAAEPADTPAPDTNRRETEQTPQNQAPWQQDNPTGPQGQDVGPAGNRQEEPMPRMPGDWQQGQMPQPPGNWQQNSGSNPYYQTPPPQGYYYGQQGPQPQVNPSRPKPPANNMAVTSMVLGIVSLLASCCCFPVGFIIGFALGMGGLVLAVLSRKGKPFSGFAVAGLVLSILGICVSLFVFVCYLITAHLMQDPEYAALFNEILRQYYNGY